jgi:hypothetical protein
MAGGQGVTYAGAGSVISGGSGGSGTIAVTNAPGAVATLATLASGVLPADTYLVSVWVWSDDQRDHGEPIELFAGAVGVVDRMPLAAGNATPPQIFSREVVLSGAEALTVRTVGAGLGRFVAVLIATPRAAA